jgi:hypothetical protein
MIVNKTKINKIIRLYTINMFSMSKIEKIVHVHRHLISKILKKNKISIRKNYIQNRYTKNIVGKKFGKWTVLKHDKHAYYICQCSCGTIRSVKRDNLISKKSKSCGCYARKKAREYSLNCQLIDKRLRRKVATTYTSYRAK